MNIHRVMQDGRPDHQRHGPPAMPITFGQPRPAMSDSRSMPLDIPIQRPPSPTSSRGTSIAGSVMSEVPPLLPLMPQFPPLDRTMDWRREDADAAIRHSRHPKDFRTAFSEGTDVWGDKSTGTGPLGRQVSQSHNDSGLHPRFQSSLDFSESRVEPPPSKQLRTGLLKSQIERGMSDDRPDYDKQLLRKLDFSSSAPSRAGHSNPPSPHPHDERRLSSTPAPMRIPHADHLSPDFLPMALNPASNPPVFPAAVMAGGIPPPHHHRRRVPRRSPPEGLPENSEDFRDYHRMRKSPSISLTVDMSEDSPRGHSHSRSREDYMELENELQMEDIPPQMNMLTLRESKTPPRTPNTANSLPRLTQTAGSKRRASSPQGTGRSRLNISQSEPGVYGENYMRRSPVGNPYGPARLSPQSATNKYHGMVNRGPGSLSTSTSSGSTAWSLLGSSSTFSAASSISTSDGLSAFSSPRDIPRDNRDSEMRDGGSPNDITPRASAMPMMLSRESGITHGISQSGISHGVSQSAITHGIAQMDADHVPTPIQRTRPRQKFGDRYICDCCPKKPKKFEHLHDLEQHEQEKQHICQYCHNRFKNKNEAERHQNSLHLRKHSWSCAAMSTPNAAFHPNKCGDHDVCGYCGKEFPLPANWDERANHLTTEHKFGECNQTKKFYRADHFRQHLKHSHSGTSGKWTNVLENACMRDEPEIVGVTMGQGQANTSPVRSISEVAE